MAKQFRPMLAAPTKDEELRCIKFPKLISAKIDGIRMLVMEVDGKPVALTRKLLPIPNRHVQRLFARPEFVGLDGELALGDPWGKDCYRLTNSAVMTAEGEPDIKWHVFDSFRNPTDWYGKRAFDARQIIHKYGLRDAVRWLSQIAVYNEAEMRAMEEGYLDQGYEGAILRDPRAPYKYGRSTLKQEWMLKIKRFTDSDAEVIGVTELQHNDNEATVDETGYTKRSSHKAGRTNAGIMGTLVARCVDPNDPFHGREFEIGTGFTAEQRANLWEGRKYLIGKIVKYKYFPIGCKDKPRHPVFIGWRDRRD